MQQIIIETFGDQKKAAKKKRRKLREREKRQLKRDEKEAAEEEDEDGLDNVDYSTEAVCFDLKFQFMLAAATIRSVNIW